MSNYNRISKAAARKLFTAGKAFWIVPCNLRPEFGILINESIYKNSDWKDFESFLNCFIYYNCNAETGRYPAYYTDDWRN